MVQYEKDISVIIRCRNEEEHIGLSIQSVIDYFENPEILIIRQGLAREYSECIFYILLM